MAIAMTLQQYLTEHRIGYDTVGHSPTRSAIESAHASRVSGDRVAKGVVLKTEDGYLLAVLPASHHIQLGQLKAWLNRPVGLATEEEISSLFLDCDLGAVPIAGAAYGLDVIVEESLVGQPEVYFEGGDHATLVHMTAGDFHRLLGDAPYAEFSSHD